MRGVVLGLAVTVAVLFPKVSNAQAYAYGTPAPAVTAGSAAWQAQSEPIMVNGLVYFPTRAFRLFDAGAMVQTGVYGGVPVYSDVTIEPYSIIYVPVTRSNMRVYERRRTGDLAGTAGSRTPAFPVDIASDTVRAEERREAALRIAANAAPDARAARPPSAAAPSPTATGGDVIPEAVSTAGSRSTADRVRSGPTRIEVYPRPASTGPNGVWLEFKGSRWYAQGSAVPFSTDRFEPIGEYRGFPVYRDRRGAKTDEIWVSVVKDGPVAPYARR